VRIRWKPFGGTWEAADELVGTECHSALTICSVTTIVLVTKGGSVTQADAATEELDPTCVMQLLQVDQEQPSKQLCGTRTGSRNTVRAPGTIMWMWGWYVMAEPRYAGRR
jgi:hypothetical protein